MVPHEGPVTSENLTKVYLLITMEFITCKAVLPNEIEFNRNTIVRIIPYFYAHMDSLREHFHYYLCNHSRQ